MVSHDARRQEAIAIERAEDSKPPFSPTACPHVVVVDEVQFFDPAIVDVCNRLADAGIRVIVAGLDLDYLGRPFGPMPLLLAHAEYVTKLHAICSQTGRPAHFSHRIEGGEDDVQIGGAESYEALAREPYNEGCRPRTPSGRGHHCMTLDRFALQALADQLGGRLMWPPKARRTPGSPTSSTDSRRLFDAGRRLEHTLFIALRADAPRRPPPPRRSAGQGVRGFRRPP